MSSPLRNRRFKNLQNEGKCPETPENDRSMLSIREKRDKLARPSLKELAKGYEKDSRPRTRSQKDFSEDEATSEEDDRKEEEVKPSMTARFDDVSRVQGQHPSQFHSSPPNTNFKTSSPFLDESGAQVTRKNSTAKKVPFESPVAQDSQEEEDEPCPASVNPKKKVIKQDSSSLYGFLFALLPIIFGTIFIYISKTSTMTGTVPNVEVKVTGQINSLKRIFPSQSAETWRTIKTNLRRINGKVSDRAACLVVLGDSKWIECFAQSVAHSASAIRNKTSGDVFKQISYDSVDQSLRRSDSVVILDLDKVDAKSALVLHAFCDSATLPLTHPFVRSSVISTIAAKPSSESPETVAGEVLTKSWTKTMTEDKISSLISRVVLAAVQFTEETSTSKLREFCTKF